MLNLFGNSYLGDLGNHMAENRLQNSNFAGLANYIQGQYGQQNTQLDQNGLIPPGQGNVASNSNGFIAPGPDNKGGELGSAIKHYAKFLLGAI